MDIKQLEVLSAVIETGSFSLAGERLHLTQPTISTHVASLERELGITLVIRTTREVYPSDAGNLLYSYAKKILTLREKAVRAMQDFSRSARGTVTVAASTIPGQYFLPRLMEKFQEQYPEIRLQLEITDSAQVVQRVTGRQAEVGFSGMASSHPKCLSQPFANDRLVVITPNQPRFQQYVGKGFPVRKLREESFLSREPGSGTRQETEAFLRELGVRPDQLRVSAEVSSTDAIKAMVAQGQGVSVVSKSACEEDQQAGRLLAFDFDSVSLRRKLYLLRRKNHILSPAAQAFFDFAGSFYPV